LGLSLVFPFISVALRPLQKRSASKGGVSLVVCALPAGLFGDNRGTAKAAAHIVSWICEERFKGPEEKSFQNSKTARAGVSDWECEGLTKCAALHRQEYLR
jgi:hypothetical protein